MIKRGLLCLCAFVATIPVAAQTPQKKDSTAKADSAAADSIALIKQLEKELGAPNADTTSTTSQSPRATGGYMNIGFVSLVDAGWTSADDIDALQPGDHDPKARGFTLPNTEITFDGNVDPYFKGFANIVYKIDKDGESAVELEEAYLQTTSLPYNLQLKAGQFVTEFGRQNPQHPHSWAFVDQPLVLNRMFGPDGLRSQGLRVSWLAPTPFYTEAMVTIANSTGETAWSFLSPESESIHGASVAERKVKAVGDLLIAPRLATSFDLTETQTLVLGASGAFGPNNSGPSNRTRVFGIDGYWKWKRAAAQAGFPFLSLQAEALSRSYEADDRTPLPGDDVVPPGEVLKDRGAYGQLLWGIKPRIVAGLRADWVKADAALSSGENRTTRSRISPNFTWYPTEFSKFRVQYNYDDRKELGVDHSLWFQFEFLLGAHAAHRF
ncbi:MAG TPA: hypothetical protein VJL35_03075 [Gemmatimonadaceae bacterium]|jgi:hypothetical protein|nr:hypothetical protein [Gemmatimonadaceae bacterium]